MERRLLQMAQVGATGATLVAHDATEMFRKWLRQRPQVSMVGSGAAVQKEDRRAASYLIPGQVKVRCWERTLLPGQSVHPCANRHGFRRVKPESRDEPALVHTRALASGGWRAPA